MSETDSPMQNVDPVILGISTELQEQLLGEATGHDWWHIKRVWQSARYIAENEKADVDMFVVDAAALLHDIGDWKFTGGDETAGPQRARVLLEQHGADPERINAVCAIVANVSFKGAGVPSEMETIEGKIVQDADRLDALGAIGIARAFAYGGKVGKPIHDPTISPTLHATFDDYKTGGTTSINHFYEKLLLLSDRLHTQTAKHLASERVKFMEDFLRRFHQEWEGNL